MNNRIFIVAVLGFMALAVVSCKDYQDDINQWAERVDSLSEHTAAMERQLKSIVYSPEKLGDRVVVDGVLPVDIVYQVEPKLQADSLAQHPERLAFVTSLSSELSRATRAFDGNAALEVTEVRGNAVTGLVTITATPNGRFLGDEQYAVALEYNGVLSTYRTAFTPVRVLTHPDSLAITLVDGTDPSLQKTAVGNSIQLNALFFPEYTTERDVTWSSSNRSVATITSAGLLTAVDNGEAMIHLTSLDTPSVTASVKITITGGYITISSDEEKNPNEAE